MTSSRAMNNALMKSAAHEKLADVDVNALVKSAINEKLARVDVDKLVKSAINEKLAGVDDLVKKEVMDRLGAQADRIDDAEREKIARRLRF